MTLCPTTRDTHLRIFSTQNGPCNLCRLHKDNQNPLEKSLVARKKVGNQSSYHDPVIVKLLYGLFEGIGNLAVKFAFVLFTTI